MSEGVRILDTKTLPCKVEQLSKYVFKIILTQGLNRQIRRMCSALGFSVVRLQRIRIMNINLGNLPIGQWRDLTKKEKNQLFSDLNYEPREW
jgi:23S rRNA pseudouridine2604 synthase